MYLYKSSTVLFWRPETYPKNCHYQKSVDEIPWYCMVWFPFTQKPLSQNVSKDLVYFVAVSRSELVKYLTNKEALGAFHLVKISGISGYVVNGTRFVGSSHWKIPRKVENLKRWARFPGWNFRTECRVPFTFLVVCTSSRSTVGHRDVPVFTTKWNNFLPIWNSTLAPTEISGFFPKWKGPQDSLHLRSSRRFIQAYDKALLKLTTDVKIGSDW